MSQWFALRCATRRERAAHDALTEKGFAVFNPQRVRWTWRRSVKSKVEAPLFAGYLFVECEPTQETFDEITALDGVHQFVRYVRGAELTPMPIGGDFIERIQGEVANGDHDLTRPGKASYRPGKGERVKIGGGIWSGHMALVLAAPPGERAQVLLEGRFAGKVTLDVAHLAAA